MKIICNDDIKIEKIKCAECGKTIEAATIHGFKPKDILCQDCALVDAERKTEKLRIEREARTREYLRYINANYSEHALRAGVPPKYHGFAMDNIIIDRHNQAAVDFLRGDDFNFVLLHGETGTGKTVLASASARLSILLGKPVVFIKAIDFFSEVRKGFNSDSKVDADVIRKKYSFEPFLILDDLGSEKMSDWVEETIYILVDNRTSYNLKTIITSNLNNAQISERYGARVARRIKEAGPRFEIGGGDRS